MKRPNRKYLQRAALILTVCAALCGCAHASQNGIEYLKKQDARDLTEVENALHEKQRQSILSRAQDASNLPAAFQGVLIAGDSRPAGFITYNVLSPDEVIYDIGVRSDELENKIDQIQQKQPLYFVWAYGLNDAASNIGADQENGYANYIENLMNQVLEVSPKTQIVLSSILPVQTGSEWHDGLQARVDVYNQQLKDLAARRGWIYVDNSLLDFSAYYGSDGEHFIPEFYPLWARNILDSILLAG